MLRRLAVVISIGLASAALAGTGDVNGSGKVTTADAVLALRIAGGLLKPTAAQQFAADVTPDAPDGAVTVADAVRITRMALQLDPAIPSGLRPVSLAVTVSGNTSRDIVLAAGYPVSGSLKDSTGAVFPGSVAFQETTTHLTQGPWALDEAGAFSGVLPAGTYQAVALTLRESWSGAGELEDIWAAVAVGSPVTVAAPVSGLAFKRPAIASPSTLTVSFTGPSKPGWTAARIYLTDTGATPASFGLNSVLRDIAITPAKVGVPNGQYWVESDSWYTLSTGTDERLYIWFDAPLTVNGATSKTLNYPALYELNGMITPPHGYPPLTVTLKRSPVTSADVTGASVDADSSYTYLIAIQAGLQTMTIGMTSPYDSTTVDYVMPYTMPAARSVKNVTVPAYPAFRTVSGRLLKPTGGTASGATISATQTVTSIPAGGRFAFSASTVTDASGAYTLYLPDGDYLFSATPS